MTAISPSVSVQKMFRYVEWTLIAVHVVYYFSLAANDTLNLTAERFWQLSAFFVTIAAWSMIFPLHRSLWSKYAYISLEILLVLTLGYLSGIHLELFIYLYIAKSCFMLRRKRTVMLSAVVGILYVGIFVWSFPRAVEAFPQNPTNYNPREPTVIRHLIANSTAHYVMSSSFVILFSSTLLAEQKSRQRAEELTQQVEGLAAQLERVRIARDIHDSFGHTLTNLQVQLALAQEFRQHKPDRAFRAIDLAKFLADQCVEDMSLTLQAMHQNDFNLTQALQSLLEQLKHNQGLKVYAEINLPPLPFQVSHHLYCIIKEGLTNLQKHSNASQLYLGCQATSDGVTARLEDNGQGFDPAQSYSGFGLQSMKERVQLLNGDLRICSAPGAGTQIQVVLPLKREN
ncbi:MAG: sensor histidine kinase [Cyanophyceae cyanobacterium]